MQKLLSMASPRLLLKDRVASASVLLVPDLLLVLLPEDNSIIYLNIPGLSSLVTYEAWEAIYKR